MARRLGLGSREIDLDLDLDLDLYLDGRWEVVGLYDGCGRFGVGSFFLYRDEWCWGRFGLVFLPSYIVKEGRLVQRGFGFFCFLETAYISCTFFFSFSFLAGDLVLLLPPPPPPS